MIRLIVCDDHAIVRRGLTDLLAAEPDLEVVGEAKDAQELLERLRVQRCDVLLLDIGLPGRSGLDVLGQIRRREPAPAVLVVSMQSEEQFALRTLRAGAAGYLAKDCAPEELLRAVRRVAAGEKYVSGRFAGQLANELLDASARPAHERLSAREFEVLRLLGAGRTVGEIAELLFLSPNTVSSYRKRLLEKLGLRNNAELMHYALTHHLAV